MTSPDCRRELLASLDRALAMLGAGTVSDDAIHEARKALKRARAALRLLRETLSERSYRTDNRALRDAGRALARLRHPCSLLEALERLQRKVEVPPYDAARLRDQLQADRASARGALRADVERSRALIQACRGRIERRRLALLTARTRGAALQRMQRRGRKAYAAARSEPGIEALHEWRKQVKYLLNALEVVGKTRHAPLADQIADRLGDDHDLALLSDMGGTDLSRMIAKRRIRLQERAFALGAKLYRAKRL